VLFRYNARMNHAHNHAETMKVVMVSKALVAGAYQRKAEEIARCGVDLTVLIPPRWRDRRGEQTAQRRHTDGYDLRVIPIRHGGRFHWHYYPTLQRELTSLRPHLLHMDEEPYNLATWLGLRAARRLNIAGTFFTWQNLYRRYPPPFCWMERACYRAAPLAIAGNRAAAAVLNRKQYGGQIAVIPQFGVDPHIFSPAPRHPTSHTAADTSPAATDIQASDHHAPRDLPSALRIGYAGGLLHEKGVDLLLYACSGLRGEWSLRIVGDGDRRTALQALAQQLNIADRVQIDKRLDSEQMPDFYRGIDVLVLPSRTMPNWQEQFGRVLIEAMACAVPVIGSDSGEIPNVIGEAGLIVAENDADMLRQRLQELLGAPQTRAHLGQLGRKRVLERFTMTQIAQQTVQAYAMLLAKRPATAAQPDQRNWVIG